MDEDRPAAVGTGTEVGQVHWGHDGLPLQVEVPGLPRGDRKWNQGEGGEVGSDGAPCPARDMQ